MKMQKAAGPMLLAFVVSLTAVPATWGEAREDVDALTQECQAAVERQPETEAARLCREGIQLLQEGKTEEAVTRMKEGLAQEG